MTQGLTTCPVNLEPDMAYAANTLLTTTSSRVVLLVKHNRLLFIRR